MGSLNLTLGVDIGQKHDPTALCLTQQSSRGGRPHFLVRHLERLPLNTLYPEVAGRVYEVATKARCRTESTLEICVDATGVGLPVIDVLNQSNPLGCNVLAVTLTGGQRLREKPGNRRSLGKSLLVSQLQALLNGGRLHLPPTAEARALAAELLNFELRVSRNAKVTSGAFKHGTHDDLVIALGLSVCSAFPRSS